MKKKDAKKLSEKHVSMAESRQGFYLTWQSWSYSEGEAVESSRRRRASWQRSISIHLIDIREPEVLLHRQPKHRDEKAEDKSTLGKVMQGLTKDHNPQGLHIEIWMVIF